MRECQSVILVRLKKHLHKHPLLSMFLMNARSMAQKMYYMELLITESHYT